MGLPHKDAAADSAWNGQVTLAGTARWCSTRWVPGPPIMTIFRPALRSLLAWRGEGVLVQGDELARIVVSDGR